MAAEKGSVIFGSHPLQHHSLECVGGLYHPRLGGVALHMLHFGIIGKCSYHAVAHHHRARLIRACGVQVPYLDMAAETYYFIPYLALEPNDYRHGNNHHRQSDGNADHGDQHSRTGNLFARLTGTINTEGYETRKVHKKIKSIPYGPDMLPMPSEAQRGHESSLPFSTRMRYALHCGRTPEWCRNRMQEP